MKQLLFHLLSLMLVTAYMPNTLGMSSSGEAILYRGDIGRTGVYTQTGLPVLQGVQWQKT